MFKYRSYITYDQAEHALRAALVGTDRIVYGSDFCWTPAARVDAQIRAINDAPPPAADVTWRTFTRRNAEVLFTR